MTTFSRDRMRSGAASYPLEKLANASADAALSRIRNAEVIESKLPWLFLSYALPAVFVLSIIMAPFQVADELAHIERADQMSRGKMISDRIGGFIDGGWDLMEPNYHRMWFHPEVKQTVVQARETGAIRWSGLKLTNFENSARYGPFLYIPQAIAVLFGRLADLRLIQTLVAARMLNGFAACIVGFFALAICRRGRALTFTTLLLPMTLSQFASASQDALLISLTVLAIALASKVLAERRPASTAEFTLFACIVVATTMARPMQFAVALLTPVFVGFRDLRWTSKGLITATMVALVILWMLILPGLTPPLNPELSPPEQFHRLLEHPLLLPTIIKNYFASEWLWLWKTVIGHLGWVDTPLPDKYYWAATGILLMALIAPGNCALVWWARILAILTFVALVTLLSIALFMTWTPVGLKTIHGMQGRYLLGMLPLLAWAIPEYSRRVEQALRSIWYPVVLFPLVTWVITPVILIERYYGSWRVMAASVKALLM